MDNYKKNILHATNKLPVQLHSELPFNKMVPICASSCWQKLGHVHLSFHIMANFKAHGNVTEAWQPDSHLQTVGQTNYI